MWKIKEEELKNEKTISEICCIKVKIDAAPPSQLDGQQQFCNSQKLHAEE